uniref:Acetyl-coenzyme A carboxylase carboxyl transferase subunit alpha n=1 Tax=uncultured Armatimonadetes bacterium TaxID=157466 RepID=A0A6J4JVE6_9BACT|nr:Acetyl-coenzyme A carboxyl transferase alpha chain [uncultured Armatimonadetes bacterium]
MASMTVLEFERQIAELESNIAKIREIANRENRDVEHEIADLEQNRDALLHDFFQALTAWDNVQLARHADRPYTLDYLPLLFDDFLELHGDRVFGDDGAMVGGLALFDGKPVVVVGQQKGRDLKERQKRNFGYSRPEGYRKALRLMHLAARFGHPVVTFVDTPGADANVPSEERGISEAIARNLREMSVLRTPIVSVIIGEGGSGGALGIAVADRVLMLEHAIYSVIAPEGCASILWRDPARGPDAARAMRVTARDAREFGFVDEVIPEPLGGAHKGPDATAAAIKDALARHLREIGRLSKTRLLAGRYEKFRAMGRFLDVAAPARLDAPPPAPVPAPTYPETEPAADVQHNP